VEEVIVESSGAPVVLQDAGSPLPLYGREGGIRLIKTPMVEITTWGKR
jgi:hypothetical protein